MMMCSKLHCQKFSKLKLFSYKIVAVFTAAVLGGAARSGAGFIRTSISQKYDLSTKITTHVQLPVASQCNCVVIPLQIGTEIPSIVFFRNTRRD